MHRKTSSSKPLRPVQRQQDSKSLRSRKDNSISPITKEIFINKENIHPNQTPQNKDTQFFKNQYFNLKAQKQYNSRTQYDAEIIPKEIQIKLPLFSSLEKCQFDPRHRCSPSSLYYVQPNGSKANELICCQDCSSVYKCKIPLKKICDTMISNDLTAQKYFQILSEKVQVLEKAKINLDLYRKQYMMSASQQMQKHRKYYHEILEVIQRSMKDSETLLARAMSHGQKQIMRKKEQINDEIAFASNELKKLLNLQQNQIYNHTAKSHISFDVQKAMTNNLELKLPLLHVFTDIPNVSQHFETLFNQQFSLKVLTPEQVSFQQQEDSSNQKPERQAPYSPYNSYNLQQKDVDTDLFCEQTLEDGKKNKGSSFSFDKKQEQSILRHYKDNCILELVEQEDAISPVFKVI